MYIQLLKLCVHKILLSKSITKSESFNDTMKDSLNNKTQCLISGEEVN